MNDLIAVLVAWAVSNSGYPAPAQLPAVEYRPATFFTEHACPPSSVHCSTRGYYEDGSNTIVLHESYRDLKKRRARAMLVHEIVHYLQDVSGRWGEKTCETWVDREHESYRLQLLYLVSEGANPFTHMMPPLSKSRCRDG